MCVYVWICGFSLVATSSTNIFKMKYARPMKSCTCVTLELCVVCAGDWHIVSCARLLIYKYCFSNALLMKK